MADLNINTVSNADSVTASDYVYISQGGNSLKKIAYDDFVASIYASGDMFSNTVGNSAGAHNSIYRGKNLGTSYTATQQAEVAAGTFRDLFIGDYWTINNVKWVIAHFDPMYKAGDTSLNTHHIAVVPATSLYSAQMQNTESGAYTAGNEYNFTTGGYVASNMRTTNLAQATEKFEAAFGASHVLTYRDLLTTAVGTWNGLAGKATNWGWNNARVELMSETMVYGTPVFGLSPYEVGCFNFQLALFRLSPEAIHTRYTYWLRNVASATSFAAVASSGSASANYASAAAGVRPLALIS